MSGAVTVTQADADFANGLAEIGMISNLNVVRIAEFAARHRHAAEAASKQRVGELESQKEYLVSALEAIERWRDDCKSYDEECGHPDRLFCEDVALIEGYAGDVLERIAARAKATEQCGAA